jgi:hypothetical protein
MPAKEVVAATNNRTGPPRIDQAARRIDEMIRVTFLIC